MNTGELKTLGDVELRDKLVKLSETKGDEALDFLSELAKGEDERVASHAIFAMGRVRSEAAATLLSKLSEEVSSKSLRKECKKSLYFLRSLGYKPAPTEEKTPPAFPGFELKPRKVVLALASHIIGNGQRFIGIVGRARGAQHLVGFFGVIGGEGRLLHGNSFSTSKKDFRGKIEGVKSDLSRSHGVPMEFYQLDPPDYGVFLLEETLSRGGAQEEALNAYRAWKQKVDPDSTFFERALVYEKISLEEVKSDGSLLAHSNELLRIWPFSSWYVPQEPLMPYVEGLRELMESPIVATGYAIEERFNSVLKEASEAVFDEKRRKLFQRSLEEMAYILSLESRDKEAKQALACAVALEENREIERIPFMLECLKREVALLLEPDEEEDEKAGEAEGEKKLIYGPDEIRNLVRPFQIPFPGAGDPGRVQGRRPQLYIGRR